MIRRVPRHRDRRVASIEVMRESGRAEEWRSAGLSGVLVSMVEDLSDHAGVRTVVSKNSNRLENVDSSCAFRTKSLGASEF